MFLDEARIAATLHHPNIVSILDIDTDKGTHFFAMEFVHGQDARTIRKEAQKRGLAIPMAGALAIGMGAAAALSYAHTRTGPKGPLGLVHRDVSPSNILVSYDGAIKLVDFGIARAVGRTTKTMTGMIKGKVSYMSPEQCRGGALDARSDLFSLGIVLYELTVGARPFEGNTDLDVLEQIIKGRVVPPTAINDQYPRALEMILMRLLEREPSARYPSADAVLVDLEALVAALGMFSTAIAVGKFMREMFGHEITAWEEASQAGRTLARHLTETGAHDVTVGKGTRRAPTAPTDAWLDASTSRYPRRYGQQLETEKVLAISRTATSRDQTPPISGITQTSSLDPLATYAADLLSDLDAEAMPDEAPDDRVRRRVETLFERAFACQGVGELDKAAVAILLALDETPNNDQLETHRSTIEGVLDQFLGDRRQRVVPVGGSVPDLPLAMATLLAQLDGTQTIEEIIAGQPIATHGRLADLVMRGLVLLQR
jgi:hypothetical protein